MNGCGALGRVPPPSLRTRPTVLVTRLATPGNLGRCQLICPLGLGAHVNPNR